MHLITKHKQLNLFRIMMRHLIVTEPMLAQIKEMRNAIQENIIDLLERHKATSADCYECDDCPVIIDAPSDDDTATLDAINIQTSHSGNKYIVFDCSGSYSNHSVALINMDIERLIEVYEWIKYNQLMLCFNKVLD